MDLVPFAIAVQLVASAIAFAARALPRASG